MDILIFILSGTVLFTAFNLLTALPCIASNQNYVKETQIKEEENEGITKPVLPTKGIPIDSEGEERNIGHKIWLCLMLIISLNVNAQYLGVQILNKGIGVNAGILANNVNIQAALTFPIMDLQNANTYSLSAGYQLNITNDDKDNYSLTPFVGAALLRSRTWDAKDAMTVHQNIKPMYGAELAKDAYMGRVFINANYSDALYYGIGIKVFFKR